MTQNRAMNQSISRWQLMASMRAFTLESDRYVEQVAGLHGLHRTDLNALGYLVGQDFVGGSMTAGRLGEALNLSSPATTALVDRLSKQGHVQRHRSDVDRRQVEVSMTEHARQVGRELFTPLSSHLSAAMENYSLEELQLLDRFLKDMTAATTDAKDSLRASDGG